MVDRRVARGVGLAIALAASATGARAPAGSVPRYTLAKDLDVGLKNGVYDKNGV